VISRQSTSNKAGFKKAGRSALHDLHALVAHRLFPMFTALWLGALLGLGSLAISSGVLSRVVVLIGLPAIVPATAPPLGFTARMLLALFMAMAGGAIGTAFGMAFQRRAPVVETVQTGAPLRRSAAPTPPPQAQPATPDAPKVRARDAHPDAPPRRPLELTEELAADAISGGPVVAGAVIAPAPELGELDSQTFFPTRVAAALAQEAATPEVPFELAVPFEEEPILLSELAPPERPEPEPAASAPSPAPLQEAAIDAARAAGLQHGDGLGRQLLADLPLNGLGTVQLIERLALALDTRRSAEQGAAADGGMPAQPAVFVPPLSALTERCASLLAAAPNAAGYAATRPASEPVLRFPGEAARHGVAAIRDHGRATPAAKAPFALPRAQFASGEDAEAALHAALATLKRMASQN